MKTLKVILLALFLTANLATAQNDDGNGKKGMREDMEKLMRQKIVEGLDISEATADKFISAFKENTDQIRSLEKENRELLKSIELDPDATDIDSKLNKILDIESQKTELKKSFFNELRTFLTPQQIAKTLVLRMNFRKKLRKEIQNQRKRNNK